MRMHYHLTTRHIFTRGCRERGVTPPNLYAVGKSEGSGKIEASKERALLDMFYLERFQFFNYCQVF